MRTNLEARVIALEAFAPRDTLTLFAGPMCEGDDPAPHEAAALAEWQRNTGLAPPPELKFRHIVLMGAAPVPCGGGHA